MIMLNNIIKKLSKINTKKLFEYFRIDSQNIQGAFNFKL